MPKKLILIDGNAIFHRAFHALPPFKTSKGQITNAIYGFLGMLITLLLKEHPEYVAIAWDRKAKTFRHEAFAEYKGTRAPAPEGLFEQLPILKEVLEAFQIPMFELDGFEADDILATIADQTHGDDLHIFIATGDRDVLQLVNGAIKIIMPEFGFQKYNIYDAQKVQEKYGVRANQMVDYKSLVGDPSDNIPGVTGIGPKGAAQLLQKYETLENIYEHAPELPEKLKEKLLTGKENAFLSKKLTILRRDAPIAFQLNDCKTHTFDVPKIEKYFQELEFKSLFKKLADLESLYNEKRQESQNYALDLGFE